MAIATADARVPIDLGQTPLFRTRLIRLGDEEHRLYLTLSHIIFDGVAIYRVFLPELAALYKAYSAGERFSLARSRDSVSRLCMLGTHEHSRAKLCPRTSSTGAKSLSGPLPETYLPTDRPHTRGQTFRGSMYPFKLNAALTSALREFCRSESVSLFHVLLAGFAALLYRYSGEERIPIGSVTAGRNRPETQPLLGYFLNTVVRSRRSFGQSEFSQPDSARSKLDHRCPRSRPRALRAPGPRTESPTRSRPQSIVSGFVFAGASDAGNRPCVAPHSDGCRYGRNKVRPLSWNWMSAPTKCWLASITALTCSTLPRWFVWRPTGKTCFRELSPTRTSGSRSWLS